MAPDPTPRGEPSPPIVSRLAVDPDRMIDAGEIGWGGARFSDERASRNKAVVRRLFDEVWNARTLDVIDELYAEDYLVDYRPYAPLRTGREAVREMVARAWETFPDYHEDLITMVAEGDRVAVHPRISGTQSGAWGPLPPTGRHLEFDEMLILTFNDQDQVVHQRGIVDNLAGLRQAGAGSTDGSRDPDG